MVQQSRLTDQIVSAEGRAQITKKENVDTIECLSQQNMTACVC